jgi:Flp pilus assembly protein TadD
MLYRLKRFASAVKEFDLSAKLDRSDKRLFFYRGSARLALGDSAAACFDLDQSLTMGMEEAKPMVDRFCRKYGY